MRKFFILFLLVVMCPRGFARDYEFTIGSHNMDTDLLSVYEFKYSGNELTLTNTWGWLGSMATDELLKEKIKSVEIGESGIVYFINAADKIVAGVFSTADGSEGFILYVNEEGNLIKTKPKNVGEDFAKDFQELKKLASKRNAPQSSAPVKKETPKEKKPVRPKGFPSSIEIKPYTGNGDTQFNFFFNGEKDKDYTIDLSTLPEKLPAIFNIPVDKDINKSLDYLVSLGDMFNGFYMEKSTLSYGSPYSTCIYPLYWVISSEEFRVNGKLFILTSNVVTLGTSPISVSFTQEKDASVNSMTIQLRLGLRQMNGSTSSADDKKVCKAVDKYFESLINMFKKKGYKVEKEWKNRYYVKNGEWSFRFENRLNNNFTYGEIYVSIAKVL